MPINLVYDGSPVSIYKHHFFPFTVFSHPFWIPRTKSLLPLLAKNSGITDVWLTFYLDHIAVGCVIKDISYAPCKNLSKPINFHAGYKSRHTRIHVIRLPQVKSPEKKSNPSKIYFNYRIKQRIKRMPAATTCTTSSP